MYLLDAWSWLSYHCLILKIDFIFDSSSMHKQNIGPTELHSSPNENDYLRTYFYMPKCDKRWHHSGLTFDYASLLWGWLWKWASFSNFLPPIQVPEKKTGPKLNKNCDNDCLILYLGGFKTSTREKCESLIEISAKSSYKVKVLLVVFLHLLWKLTPFWSSSDYSLLSPINCRTQ